MYSSHSQAAHAAPQNQMDQRRYARGVRRLGTASHASTQQSAAAVIDLCDDDDDDNATSSSSSSQAAAASVINNMHSLASQSRGSSSVASSSASAAVSSSAAAAPTTAAASSSAASAAASTDNNEETDKECAICYENVVDRGCLDSCNHLFCFQCIKSWSDQSNTCPMCKARFHNITKMKFDDAKQHFKPGSLSGNKRGRSSSSSSGAGGRGRPPKRSRTGEAAASSSSASASGAGAAGPEREEFTVRDRNFRADPPVVFPRGFGPHDFAGFLDSLFRDEFMPPFPRMHVFGGAAAAGMPHPFPAPAAHHHAPAGRAHQARQFMYGHPQRPVQQQQQPQPLRRIIPPAQPRQYQQQPQVRPPFPQAQPAQQAPRVIDLEDGDDDDDVEFIGMAPAPAPLARAPVLAPARPIVASVQVQRHPHAAPLPGHLHALFDQLFNEYDDDDEEEEDDVDDDDGLDGFLDSLLFRRIL